MNFFETLERARSKPEETRRKITIIIVASIMFFIVAIWTFTINFSIRNNASAGNEGPRPGEIFSDTVRSGGEKLKWAAEGAMKAIFRNEEYNNN